MTKDELKPIDVSKYKVTETGQVLKMTNFEKHANLDSIKTVLICEQIPFEYNAKELTIKIKGIDMTDILLAVHDYSSEFITDLIKENAKLKSFIDFRYLKQKRSQEKLDKAKDIIRELLSSCFGYNSKTVNYEVKVKAEQFLDEVSE